MNFFDKTATQNSTSKNQELWKTAAQRIEQAKSLLNDIAQESKAHFLFLLAQRIADFSTALDKKDLSKIEREEIIKQFNQFANHLYSCLLHPQNTTSVLTHYHSMQRYYYVGIDKPQTHESGTYYAALSGTILGAVLILASLIAFALNPLIATVLLPIGITLLAPCSFALSAGDPIDCTEKKQEEVELFQIGAQLRDPSLNFKSPEAQVCSQLACAI